MAAGRGTEGPVFKVVLLGEVGVGKTSLFYRLRDNDFKESVKKNNVVNSCSKIVTVGNHKISFTVWDTAGEERFRTLTLNYYRNAHAVVVLYSVDNPSSLHFLPKWVDDANAYAPFGALKLLIGNKCDLGSEIKPDAIDDFKSIYCIDLAFTLSAKTGEGVEEAFYKIAEKLLIDLNAKHEMPAFLKIQGDRVIVSHADETKQKNSNCTCG
ncbi:ras-related protein Rab-1C-like [Tubulanus polymorphus]|uniref:ras-related protein Rab-1C-like n=1 Tax=Tubulanus polymorphus TaxID=672921 RepID=UPI003DA5A6CA